MLFVVQASANQWGYVFLTSAAVASIANVFFILKGSGDVQDYDDLDEKEGEYQSFDFWLFVLK